MGLGGISIWQLLIILAIVIMLFGTKRLRTLGSDLGSAVKGFRKSMTDDDAKADEDKEAEGDDPLSSASGAARESHENGEKTGKS
jgi:sec-independent protein translocase protein TatA